MKKAEWPEGGADQGCEKREVRALKAAMIVKCSRERTREVGNITMRELELSEGRGESLRAEAEAFSHSAASESKRESSAKSCLPRV
jgi:hypothetical protein